MKYSCLGCFIVKVFKITCFDSLNLKTFLCLCSSKRHLAARGEQLRQSAELLKIIFVTSHCRKKNLLRSHSKQFTHNNKRLSSFETHSVNTATTNQCQDVSLRCRTTDFESRFGFSCLARGYFVPHFVIQLFRFHNFRRISLIFQTVPAMPSNATRIQPVRDLPAILCRKKGFPKK